ncbi:hypothetical protein ACFOD9_04405 [Novosphingobium bradum]|uniref:Uncharacterized protein n=1 Tax=Novosphingobium bradum TaxID=1737444 RepID=A0ABV7ITL2_9SPHN
MSAVFSSRQQLDQICLILSRYIRLPVSTDTIPGAFLEAVLAHVRGALRLNTYDYVDIHRPQERVGWSIKSTLAATPVTWKRAKLPNQAQLIAASEQSDEGLQALGDAIISFCNAHAHASLARYGLDEIGYARLIVHRTGDVTYFERKLCDRANPDIFSPRDFEWQWSSPKKTVRKEQLPALHGRHRETGKKWWAWHGRGENQLHFNGDSTWWPARDDPHAISFRFPAEDEKISFERLTEVLEAL